MDLPKSYIWGFMLYDLKSVVEAGESASCINSELGEDTVCQPVAQDWFDPFRTGNHHVEYRSRSGRAFELDDEH